MNINPIATNAQIKRKWIQLRLDQTPFNQIVTARLFGEPERKRLCESIEHLAQSLDFFRIGFRGETGDPFLELTEESGVPEIEFHNLSDWEELEKQRGFQELLEEIANRAFSLEHPPLCRFALVQLRRTELVLISVFHELIGDEFSGEHLFERLVSAYEGTVVSVEELNDINLQNKGVGLQGLGKRNLSNILKEFQDELSPLDLAHETTRPPLQTFGTSYFQFDVPIAPRSVHFAVFLELMARSSGHKSFDVGVLVDRRSVMPGFENLPGPMSNVCPLRFNRPRGATGEDLIRLSALEIEKVMNRSDVAFESILEGLGLDEDLSRNPLIQVLFGFSEEKQLLESKDFMLRPELRLRLGSEFELEFHFLDTGEELICTIIFNSKLFTLEKIRSISRHYLNILFAFQTKPGQVAEGFAMLTGTEDNFLMQEGRGKFLAVPPGMLLYELVERQVARSPDKTAMIFGGRKFSFAEINGRANLLARFLEKEGVGPDVLVGIAMSRTPLMIFAILAVLKAGGGYIPLDITHPVERLEALLEDAGFPILLTDHETPSFRNFSSSQGKSFNLSEFNFESGGNADNLERKAGPENLAFVVFTSGSTGRPKGTLLPHRALVNLILNMRDVLEPEPEHVWLAHTSINFDLSIPEIFLGLSCGFAFSLVPTGDAADGNLLLSQIKRDSVSFVQSTPATLRILLDAGWAGEPRLELMSGGDFLPLDLGNRLAGLASRVNHGYGPTETTVWSSSYPITKAHKEYFPLGKPFANTTQYVLDEQMRLLPPGVSGEVYIGGDCVARGYMNRPGLTAEKFVPDPFSKRPGARLYRSGDRAFVTPEGYLRFVGRTDQQIKIRGFRVEIGEVQFALSSFPGIETAVVLAHRFGDQKQLCGYYTVKETSLREEDLREYLNRLLPEYMVPVFLLELEQFPLTIRNKIDRNALPLPGNRTQAKDVDFIEPGNEKERKTAAIMAELFSLERLSIDADFFRLGGRSLTANRLAARIRTEFGVQLSLRDIFESPTPAAIAHKLGERAETFQGLRPSPGKQEEASFLSFGQKRLWFMERFLPTGAAYNMGFYMSLKGELDVNALGLACDEVVKRHGALRTTIKSKLGEPCPVLGDFVGSYLEVTTPPTSPERNLDELVRVLSEKEFLQPFDLEAGPLFRIKLCPLEEQHYVFLFTVHHMAFDDWSATVFFRQLREYYHAFTQGHSPAQKTVGELDYMDFARYQNKLHGAPPGATEQDFWRQRLGDLPVLNLNPDIHRPDYSTFTGRKLDFTVDRETLVNLKTFCEERGVTLFMALATAYQILISRYSGQTLFALGSPTSGRTLSETEEMIGFFVNNIVLRADLRGNPSFGEALARVRDSALEVFEFEDVPFEKVVEALNPSRELNRHPVFQVVLAFQEETLGEALQLEGMDVEPLDIALSRARLDLELQIYEAGEELKAELIFNELLFDSEKIANMPEMFLDIIRQGVQAPEVGVLGAAAGVGVETAKVPEYKGPLFLDIFGKAVAHFPNNVAVSFQGRSLTYRELDEISTGVAVALRRRGAGPDAPVGLCLERSHFALVGFLGILKSGAAYLPLEAYLPDERIDYFLEDSEASLVLVDTLGESKLAGKGLSLLSIYRDFSAETETIPEFSPALSIDGASIAYIMYTSGTSGKPKGVQITHESMAGFLVSQGKLMGLRAEDRILSFFSFNFDVSVSEFILGLGVGAEILMESSEALRPGPELLDLIRTIQATVVHLPAAVLAALPREELPELRMIVTGGEKCPLEAVRFWAEGRTFFNAYGPTETTVAATILEVGELKEHLTLGKPMDDSAIYILDEHMDAVSPGAEGEIYISGSGVARGYLNRPGLSAERFLPDPFAAKPGTRMYRTGDLGRILKNGELDFLGRVDRQIKVRGYRIEPEEIESLLFGLEGIVDAAVVACKTSSGENQLVAFLIDSADGPERIKAIRAELKSKLPDYMIPAVFKFLEQLPLTSNGKTDYKALQLLGGEPVQGDFVSRGETPVDIISGIWCELLGVNQINPADNFFDLGGHSLLMLRAQARLKDIFKKEANHDLSVTDLFQYPSIEALLELLEKNTASDESLNAPVLRNEALANDFIAVVGMSGQFPGADNLEQFWENLKNGVDSISHFTKEELRDSVGDEILERSDYVRAAGIIERADLFDAEFFGIAPREAQLMDPQHRLFLEQCYLAIENAGYNPRNCPGKVAVFAGAGLNDYALNNLINSWTPTLTEPHFHVALGSGADFLTTRVSYHLNLKGPSMVVQTACSTALVALQSACAVLLSGESDMSLAGGSNIFTPIKAGYRYEEGGILSADGTCRAFDAQADGTVNGSGVGVVVLKRLSDALRDGDEIQAVIRGVGINNDGSRKVSYTAPGVAGQVGAIREALVKAQVPANSIGYVEAHGTGTNLGDPIELAALQEALGGEDVGDACAIGSVKSNIGHLSVAAGVAGLIKVVLSLKHAQLPPSLHYTAANPGFDFSKSPFYINTDLKDWKNGQGPRRAGVSSFGIGGTNVHAILEEAPKRDPLESSRPWHLLSFSARSPESLQQKVEDMAEFLRKKDSVSLADVAYTSLVGRERFRYRTTFACRDREDAIHRLESAQRIRAGVAERDGRDITLLFPGQGPQYPGMAQDLYENEPVFKAAADHCFDELEGRNNIDLRELIYGDSVPMEERIQALNNSANAQPAMFIMGYSLAKLLFSQGYKAEALFGQSLGEYAAACLAGVFSPGDVVELLSHRGRWMEERALGGTIIVFAEEKLIPDYISHSLDPAINAPGCLVLSGLEEKVDEYQQELKLQGLEFRKLNLRIAAHSFLMESIQDDYADLLSRVKFSRPNVPLISNVTGLWADPEEIQTVDYWLTHMRQTVLLSKGFETLLEQGSRICVEAGPGHGICSFFKDAAAKEPAARAFPLLRSRSEKQKTLSELDDRQYMTRGMGSLWESGVLFDPEMYYQNERRVRTAIPGYPFERKSHWIKSRRTDKGVETQELKYSESPAQVLKTGVKRATGLEAEIAELWENVLGIEGIQGDENFFNLGGDSLLAVHLTSRLREYFGAEVSVKNFIENPTIKGQLKLLESQNITTGKEAVGKGNSQNASDSPVTPGPSETESLSICLRRGQGTENIFLMPPAGGSTLCYMGLAERLNPLYSVYGFESQGLHDERPVLTKITEMAEVYLRELREIQPSGPYRLAGWSGGAVIAYEMARVLRLKDEEIKFLGLVDAGLEHSGGAEKDLMEQTLAFLKWLTLLFDFRIPTSFEDLKIFGQWVGVNLPVSFQEIFDRDMSSIFNYIFNLASEIPRFLPVYKANFTAVLDYVPGAYDGNATLFRTGEAPGAEEEDEMIKGLVRYIGGSLELRYIRGNHMTLLDRYNVESLATAFDEALKKS